VRPSPGSARDPAYHKPDDAVPWLDAVALEERRVLHRGRLGYDRHSSWMGGGGCERLLPGTMELD